MIFIKDLISGPEPHEKKDVEVIDETAEEITEIAQKLKPDTDIITHISIASDPKDVCEDTVAEIIEEITNITETAEEDTHDFIEDIQEEIKQDELETAIEKEGEKEETIKDKDVEQEVITTEETAEEEIVKEPSEDETNTIEENKVERIEEVREEVDSVDGENKPIEAIEESIGKETDQEEIMEQKEEMSEEPTGSVDEQKIEPDTELTEEILGERGESMMAEIIEDVREEAIDQAPTDDNDATELSEAKDAAELKEDAAEASNDERIEEATEKVIEEQKEEIISENRDTTEENEEVPSAYLEEETVKILSEEITVPETDEQRKESSEKHVFPEAMEKRRRAAINELVDSEESYCKWIESMESYQKALSKVLTEDQQRLLFSNTKTLIMVSKSFSELFREERDKGPVNAEIYKCFCNSKAFIKMFVPYIERYQEASALVAQLTASNKQFRKIITTVENEEVMQPLSSLIVMPVQRMPKYSLLMKEILKATPEWHPDYERLKVEMEDIQGESHNADLKLKEATRRNQLYSLQSTIKSCPNLMEANRSLIGIWKLAAPDKEIAVMDDIILILSKEKRGDMKVIEQQIELNEFTKAVEAEDGIELLDASSKGITLAVIEKKELAVEEINKAIGVLEELRQRLNEFSM